MAKKKVIPRFVNLSGRPVMVFDEDKRTIRVQPFVRHDDRRDAIFVVEGDHYSQFVSGRGPLAPFPEGTPLPDHGVVGTHATRDALAKAVAVPAPAARLVPPPAAPTPVAPAAAVQAGKGAAGAPGAKDEGGADEEMGEGEEDAASGGAGNEPADDLEGEAEEANEDVTGTVEVDVDDDEPAPRSAKKKPAKKKMAKKKKRG